MQQLATNCKASTQVAARRFERISGIYFHFNVEQGLQEVGLGQWERLDEVRAHTGQYIWMADVDPRLDAAVASICGPWKADGHSHGAYKYGCSTSTLIMSFLKFL